MFFSKNTFICPKCKKQNHVQNLVCSNCKQTTIKHVVPLFSTHNFFECTNCNEHSYSIRCSCGTSIHA